MCHFESPVLLSYKNGGLKTDVEMMVGTEGVRVDVNTLYEPDSFSFCASSIPTYDTMTRFPRASAPPRHADW